MNKLALTKKKKPDNADDEKKEKLSRGMKDFLKQYEEQKEAEVAELREKLMKVVEECEQLRREKEELQNETSDVIKHLRESNEKHEREIEHLHKELEQTERKLLRDKKESEWSLQNEIITMKLAAAHKDKQMKDLEDELEMLSEFKANRQQYLTEIEHFKLLLEETKKKQKQKIARLNQKFYDEKVRLQKQFTAKLLELRKLSHEEAVTRLGDTTKQLFVENRTMTEELQLQMQATERLKIKKKQLEEENKRLQRDLELQEASLKEYALQQQQRKAQIAKLKERIAELEGSITKVKVDTKAAQQTVSAKVHKELEESKLDVEGLRKLVELKSKELRKIKMLARNVIEQRTELEQFFLDALVEVKAEMLKKKERDLSLQSSSRPRTPSSPTGVPADYVPPSAVRGPLNPSSSRPLTPTLSPLVQSRSRTPTDSSRPNSSLNPRPSSSQFQPLLPASSRLTVDIPNSEDNNIPLIVTGDGGVDSSSVYPINDELPFEDEDNDTEASRPDEENSYGVEDPSTPYSSSSVVFGSNNGSRASTASSYTNYGSGPIKFPTIQQPVSPGGSITSATSTEQKLKVDIQDMTWEDKEKVLRLLFSKMNNPYGKF